MLDTVKINHVQHISFTQSRLTDAVSVILSELLSYEHPSKAGAFLYAGIAKRAAKWAHILAETTVLCKKPLQRLRFWRRCAIITYNVCSIPCIQY